MIQNNSEKIFNQLKSYLTDVTDSQICMYDGTTIERGIYISDGSAIMYVPSDNMIRTYIDNEVELKIGKTSPLLVLIEQLVQDAESKVYEDLNANIIGG